PHFTAKQGQYLAFIHAYRRFLRPSPPQTDMQNFFLLPPPSVPPMVVFLPKTGLLPPPPRKTPPTPLPYKPPPPPPPISRYDQSKPPCKATRADRQLALCPSSPVVNRNIRISVALKAARHLFGDLQESSCCFFIGV